MVARHGCNRQTVLRLGEKLNRARDVDHFLLDHGRGRLTDLSLHGIGEFQLPAQVADSVAQSFALGTAVAIASYHILKAPYLVL